MHHHIQVSKPAHTSTTNVLKVKVYCKEEKYPQYLFINCKHEHVLGQALLKRPIDTTKRIIPKSTKSYGKSKGAENNKL